MQYDLVRMGFYLNPGSYWSRGRAGWIFGGTRSSGWALLVRCGQFVPAPASFCQFVAAPASACQFVAAPASACQFVAAPASFCQFVAAHASLWQRLPELANKAKNFA